MTEPHVPNHSSPHSPTRSTSADRVAPGRMTAVMRATAASAAPRVLRVGLVRAGRVVEERTLKRPSTITIGRDEGCTFVVSDPDAPPCAAVLVSTRDGYVLDARAATAGRVALVDGVHDAAALRARGAVKLDERSRGRLAVGGVTLLFQFVAAPPPSPRPQLPLSVREGIAFDWRLTVIAAFSFLAHFGLVGALVSDWMDPIVDEHVAVGIVDDLARWPAPEPEAAPETTPDPSHAEPKPDPSAKPDPTPSRARDGGRTAPHGDAPAKQLTDEGARALAAEAKAIGIEVLASTGSKSAVDNALQRSNLPTIDLTEAARSSAVVARATDPGTSGAPIVARPGKNDLGAIVGHTAVADADAARHLGAPKPPPASVEIARPDMPIPVPNAEATIARLRPRFRSCYERGLASNPGMSGSVLLRTKIGPNGQVVEVAPSSQSGLSDDVASCLARAVRNADFDPPGGTGSVIQIPVKLVQQR